MKIPDVIYLQWYDEFGREDIMLKWYLPWSEARKYGTDIVYIRQGEPPIVPEDYYFPKTKE